jgi:ElaB/YqjD/DUF883 family membrane-anchored ribosome-binding protein
MTADAVVARELKSLQEELSASEKERAAASVVATGVAPPAAEPIRETAEERELKDQLRQLAGEVTTFFEEAEKNISAHPTQSVVGAFLAGILVGRLLGRR